VKCVEPVDRFRKQLMELVGREAEADGLAGELPQFVDESFAVYGELSALGPGGYEGALPVPHFEQPFAAEPVIDAEDGVLIDGELAGELPY
jgi:hypothetical protein